jgi:hypothetical protein
MKAAGIALMLLLVAACGSTSLAARTTTSPPASPSPTPTALASAAPQPTPQPALLFAVLEAKGTANAWTYNTVAIAGLDGYARAKTTFTPMPVPNAGCMGAIIPPSAHVAAGKVYFADGHGVVRSLGVDNKVMTVATFPMTSTQQMLSFAVSPDGAQIVGTLFTIPATGACGGTSSAPFAFDAYVATSATTTRLLYHQSSTTAPQAVLALTGWDSVGPLGTYPTVWASQGGGPGSTLGVLVRVDATTLKPGGQFSDPSQCQVWDSVPSGRFVCQKDLVSSGGKVVAPVSVRNPDGTEMWAFNFSSTNGASGARLSPDARHVTICCAEASGFDYSLIGQGAPQVVQLPPGFYGEAWLDSQTLVGSFNTNPTAQPPFSLAYVALNAPSTYISMGFSGSVVGTVRT